jgi:hypothetical protein
MEGGEQADVIHEIGGEMRTLLLILALSLSTQAAALTISGCIEGSTLRTYVEVREKDRTTILFPSAFGCFSTSVPANGAVMITPRSMLWDFSPQSVNVSIYSDNVAGITFTSGYKREALGLRF